MGCKQSRSDPEAKKSDAIDAKVAEDHKKAIQDIKLLLLGAGESGKSAIFKQIRLLHGQPQNEEELMFWRTVVESNTIEAMSAICNSLERLGLQGKITFPNEVEALKSADFKIRLTAPLAIPPILDADGNVTNAAAVAAAPEMVGTMIKRLWKEDKAIKAAWEKRSQIQLVDSHIAFFHDIDRIMQPRYTPTPPDVVLARIRTTGITSDTFRIENRKFILYDVGGQRNERRKWIHAFDDVTAVIFVVALSEYDQSLFEDGDKNRMMEALGLFEWISGHNAFAHTPMLLFLNKIDLLREKIAYHPIGAPFFSDYKGGSNADLAAKYFMNKFLAVGRKRDADRVIFPHITCATDASNVDYVFSACCNTILKDNLAESGLL